MRTTIDLDDHLHAWARDAARERGTTFTAIVEEALARMRLALPPDPRPFDFPRVRGTYLGGVDLADRDALYDLLDEP